MDSTQFISNIKKQYAYYRHLAEKAIDQVNQDEFFYQQSEEVNSIAIIVKHISGNLMSRFKDFRFTDGEKEWRNRDDEFVATASTKEDYMEVWKIAWTVLFNELDELNDTNINDSIFIRNQSHTIPTALIRSVSHTSYHIGQIIHQAKIFRGSTWISLSIPRGQSQQFNEELNRTKQVGQHYTDDLLKP